MEHIEITFAKLKNGQAGKFYRPIRLPDGALLAFDAKELRRGGSTAEVGGIE